MPAAVKKKAATKKATAKKAAAKATPEEEPRKRIPMWERQEFIDEVVTLRDEQELKWAEIVEKMDSTNGRVMWAYMVGTVKPKDRIKFSDDDDLSEKIVSARDTDGLSWGIIAARARVPEGKVKTLYEKQTGKSVSSSSIGKGGRPPANGDRPAAKKTTKSAKKASGSAKKAGGAAKSTAPIKNFREMNLEELQERLNGKTLTYGGKNNIRKEMIKVGTVTKLDGDEMSVKKDDGKPRTLFVSAIAKASR